MCKNFLQKWDLAYPFGDPTHEIIFLGAWNALFQCSSRVLPLQFLFLHKSKHSISTPSVLPLNYCIYHIFWYFIAISNLTEWWSQKLFYLCYIYIYIYIYIFGSLVCPSRNRKCLYMKNFNKILFYFIFWQRSLNKTIF